MHENKKLKGENGVDMKKEGIITDEQKRVAGSNEEVKIIKIVTPLNEPGFRRFYEVSNDDSKERALSEIELLELHDQVANKIQDYGQFGPNEAGHPHSMAEYKQWEKARLEKMKLDNLTGGGRGYNLVED